MNRTFGKLFALVAIAAVFAVACGNSPAAAKKMIIGDILYKNEAYQTAQQKQMQAYADSLGIQIVFENQLGKGTNAPNLMDDLLSKGVDGIIFQPADAAVSVPLVKEAQAKKIPVLGWAIPFGEGVTAPYVVLDERSQTVGAGKGGPHGGNSNPSGKPVDELRGTVPRTATCQGSRVG